LNKKTLSSLIATLLIVSVLVMPQMQFASADVIKVTLEKNTGKVGDKVTVSGYVTAVVGNVSIYWDSEAVLLAKVSVSVKYYGYGYGYTGYFNTKIEIPEDVVGDHYIIIKDPDGKTAVKTFTIEPKITLSPTRALPGDTVSVTGKGFTAKSTVTLTLSNSSKTWALTTDPKTVKTDEKGTFDCSFKIPKDVTYTGSYTAYTVTAKDGASKSATAELKVGATVTLSPTSGPSGTVVTVSGRGFTAKKTITITMDGTSCKTVGSIKVGDDGTFEGKFVVPTLAKGKYTVSVTDGTIAADYVTFEVTGTTSIKVSPLAGAPGDTITITGKNFAAKSGVKVTIDFGTLAGYATTTTDENGTFTLAITIPDIPVGKYDIKATDEYGLTDTQSDFRVAITTLTILPSSGPSGSKVHVVGGGFTENTDFNVTINGKLMVNGKNKTDGNGNLDIYVYVPTVDAVGTYTITVMDKKGVKATESFEVTGVTQISVSPSSSATGAKVNIELKYFTANATAGKTTVKMTIYNVTSDGDVSKKFDLWQYVTASKGYTKGEVDKTGTFKGTFKLPSSFATGDYIINATDTNGLKAKVSFSVVPPEIILNTGATTYYPGDKVAFYAKCQFDYENVTINLYDPNGFKYEVVDLDIVTLVGNYYTGTVSYMLPSDAALGTWTWNTTIGGLLKEGTFTVAEKPTTVALSEDVAKLKADVASLAQAVSNITDIVTTQASDIETLSTAVSNLQSAVSDISDAVDTLATDVSSAKTAAENASTAAEAAQTAVSGIQNAVYGAVILSLIAAVAAIMSIVIMQRKIAG